MSGEQNQKSGSQDFDTAYEIYLDGFASIFELPDLSSNLVLAFSNPDSAPQRMAQAIQKNPVYRARFLDWVVQTKELKSVPSIETAVLLMGVEQVRDTLVCWQMGTTVEFAKLTPHFLAGLQYDLLREELLTRDTLGEWIVGLNSAFNRAEKESQTLSLLAEWLPEFSFKQHLSAGPYLTGLGRLLLEICVNQEEAKLGQIAPPTLQNYREEKKTEINAGIMAGLVAHASRGYRPIEQGLQYYQRPYVLKKHSRNHHIFAVGIYLAQTLTHQKNLNAEQFTTILGHLIGMSGQSFDLWTVPWKRFHQCVMEQFFKQPV